MLEIIGLVCYFAAYLVAAINYRIGKRDGHRYCKTCHQNKRQDPQPLIPYRRKRA